MTDSDDLLRVALVVLGVLLLAPLLVMGLMVPMMGFWWAGGAPGMMTGGGAGLWWVGAMLVPLLLLALVGYGLYRLLAGRGSDTDRALEELRLAYARGDLTDDEFETRRERLQN